MIRYGSKKFVILLVLTAATTAVPQFRGVINITVVEWEVIANVPHAEDNAADYYPWLASKPEFLLRVIITFDIVLAVRVEISSYPTPDFVEPESVINSSRSGATIPTANNGYFVSFAWASTKEEETFSK